eukprot:scaffold7338_cov430-Prasinococcus_capsulatus_cf.AAC.1
MKSGELTRIFTTPYGSETTSPYFYPNINGFAYFTAVIQHPYGESDQAEVDHPFSMGSHGYIGVLGPIAAQTGTVNAAPGPPEIVFAQAPFADSAVLKHTNYASDTITLNGVEHINVHYDILGRDGQSLDGQNVFGLVLDQHGNVVYDTD